MPTAKKKSVATKTKSTAAKKSVAHKKPVVAHTSKRTQSSFFVITPTIEAVYWVILGVVVIVMAAWVLNLTSQIDNLYDQVQVINASNTLVSPHPIAHPLQTK